MVQIAEIQRSNYKTGATRDLSIRISQLNKLKEAIIKHETDIYSALKDDLGKSTLEAFNTEVGLLINEIDYMISNLGKLTKRRRVKTPLMFFGGSSYIVPEPYGTVLIIGPWNYPFMLVMSPLIGAIAAGNCVVIKPSELAPNISKVISTIINNNFSKEFVCSIEGGIEVSNHLLAQKFDYIFFTGSKNVGKVVMEAAAKNLTPVTLELGGKSPCIVDCDTNLKTAARRIAWGKFLNSGQTCVAPDYLFVHKKIKDELVREIIASIKEFYGENLFDSEFYSKVINERHFDRLLSLVNDGNILFGGESRRESLKIGPTLIDSLSEDSKIMQDEIFGPLLPILEFDNICEVIDFVNNRPKPLALYIFSNSKKNIKRVLGETSSGGACINDTINHITTPYLPFGGVGESGMGSYHGRHTFETFSHKKSVLNSQILIDMKVKYPPYKASVDSMKKMFKVFLK